jgi:hypothetical protein
MLTLTCSEQCTPGNVTGDCLPICTLDMTKASVYNINDVNFTTNELASMDSEQVVMVTGSITLWTVNNLCEHSIPFRSRTCAHNHWFLL